jgi:DNA repair exonuclease SbcCD nuclease subunit
MKILHTGDVHARDKDVEEISRCLVFLVDTAMREEVDLAVIAGDLFDSRDVKMDSPAGRLAIRFVSDLANVCPVAVVIGTPSHEGNAPEILRHVRGACQVFVSEQPTQISLVGITFFKPRPKAGAIITLIPQPTKQFFQSASDIRTSDQEIGQAMSALFAGFGAQAAEYPGAPHILVGHWNTKGSELSNGQIRTGMDIEIGQDQMMLARPDLICLGHIHKPQRLGDRAFYCGSLYATNAGEDHEHGFYIHELSNHGDPIISRFIETPCKRLARFSKDFTSGDPISFLHDYEEPENRVPAGHFDGVDVRLELRVWQDEAGKIDKAAIEAFYKSAGALDVDIRIVRVPRETVRAAEVLRVDRLRDKISEMAALKDEAVPGQVLIKADLLEAVVSDELIGQLAGGAA